MPLLGVYKDSDLKVPISKLESTEIIQAGGKWEVSLYIQNISGFELMNVQLSIDDPDVTITPSVIPYLAPLSYVEVKFVWAPKINRENPLNARILADIFIIKRAG